MVLPDECANRRCYAYEDARVYVWYVIYACMSVSQMVEGITLRDEVYQDVDELDDDGSDPVLLADEMRT